MSSNLDLIQIDRFKNPVSVSDDQCLQYVRKQCVSSEDIIFTVHIGYDCLHVCMEQSKNAYYKSHVVATSSFFWMCCKERQKKGRLALNNQEHSLVEGDSCFPPSLF